MDSLISRAAAIAKVEKARKAARTLTGMDFVLMLKDQPAVDAAPVVHGRWIEVSADIVCSNCKAAYDSEVACLYKGELDLQHLNGFEYCPHCGAKMDGERRESE